MNINRKTNRAARKGAAFLLLVLMVLLVVVGATHTLVRGELTIRRSETERLRVRSMVAAINAMQQISDGSTDPIRLPLADTAGEFIEVSINEEQSQITARWIKDTQMIDEMTKQINNKVESNE